jgi:hypothetical protein
VPVARPRLTAVVAALAVALSLLGAGATQAPAASQPIQLGAFVPGAPGDARILDGYASMVGRRPDIVMMFRDLNGPLLYPNEIPHLRERGETPMVTLEPYSGSGMASFPDIVAGRYDSYFRQEADAVRGLNMTVLLRFAHEMNLPSIDWGAGKDGNTGSSYAEAWRHVVSVFRQEGATNVKWVWAPNVDYGGRPFAQYFPGDQWVDYVGLDGYNWGTSSGDSWSSFSKVFASSYSTITQLSSRPLIISETASSETGGGKAAWIEEAFFETIPTKMPRIAAVVWFDDNKERDWAVDSSQASLDAYRKVVASTLYGGTQPLSAGEEPPVVDELNVTPTVTAPPAPESAGGSPKRHHHGSVHGHITYRLSQRAVVRITLRRRRRGARPLVLSAEQFAGHKRVSLARLIGERRLSRGDYRVSVIAIGRAGTRSKPRHHRFRVVVPRQQVPLSGLGSACPATEAGGC